MNSEKIQSLVVGFLVIALIVVALAVIWPYFGVLILSGVFAIVFEPLFEKILHFLKYRWVASLATVLVVLFVVLLPLAFFGTLVFNEARQIYEAVFYQGGLGSSSTELLSFFREKLPSLIPQEWGRVDFESYAETVVSWLVINLGSVFSTIAQGILTFAFSLFALFYLLKDSRGLEKFLSDYSPLSQKNLKIITEKIKLSVNSVIRGSIVVATLQGIVSGFGFAIFGLPNPALWGGLTVIAALVPTVGTSLVVIPAVIYLFLTGSLWQSLGLIIWGILAVGLLDNFLNPQLIKRGIKIHPLIILLSVLGGIGLFGPLGFVLGPLIFSLLFAVLEIYKTIEKDKASL